MSAFGWCGLWTEDASARPGCACRDVRYVLSPRVTERIAWQSCIAVVRVSEGGGVERTWTSHCAHRVAQRV
jgi:hypothetical protein